MGIELKSKNFGVAPVEGRKELEPLARLPEKGEPVAHGRGFQLQAEWQGDTSRGLEFVTNPPGVPTLEAWLQHGQAMARG